MTEYEVQVTSGFTPLKNCSYTVARDQDVVPYTTTIKEKSKIKQLIFGGFSKCLYPLQKFDSDTERRFSSLLERHSLKWLKPAAGQFNLYYRSGTEHPAYLPDFIAETDKYVLMIETKSAQHKEKEGGWSEEVTEKAKAGSTWCKNASQHLLANGGKEWKYLLIPHDEVKDHNTLDSFISRFTYIQ
ncbi:hypothetical protein [Vibrio sp. 1180_3]|uniref:hypothetical protein n=1 Tax=Vibrio sp. 1180_3 TaxID=2528832 RepID=UPI002405EF78|nr:hypothetical protein [Vibrio sp. 1180_3]